MAIKFSHQFNGAFIMFLVLQSFLVESRHVKLEPPHNQEQGHRKSNGTSDGIAPSTLDGLYSSKINNNLYGGKWYKSPLTYGFDSTSPLPSGSNYEDVISVIDEAFQKWQAVVPEFAFQRIYPGEYADITIMFTTISTEYCGYSYYPPDGRLYLDIDHTYWSIKSYPARNEHDLLSATMHEIGHTLGLMHIYNRDAVMYPTLDYGTIKRELSQEDIDRIQSLYYDEE
ncbi:hypothetical protein V6N13_092371 [Hibiscus sabdariffa]|uniref:Peptidase metallopeptidase domain-containing protein n=1 Tax=Hibiscus sabdariffa TaxID=183260 RepID=A0ABR2CC55_9ROSI